MCHLQKQQKSIYFKGFSSEFWGSVVRQNLEIGGWGGTVGGGQEVHSETEKTQGQGTAPTCCSELPPPAGPPVANQNPS